MNESEKKIILRIAGIFLIVLLGIWSVTGAIQSEQSRRLCNQYRERIAETERENRELGTRIEQCQSICRELECSVERNVSTAREAIELIEEIRTQVYSLELVTGNFSWDEYYSHWDNILFGQ